MYAVIILDSPLACRNDSGTEREAAGWVRVGIGAVITFTGATAGVDLFSLAECANRRAVRGLSSAASAKGERSFTRAGV